MPPLELCYMCKDYVYIIMSLGICKADEFDCGQGYCTDASAECDGFVDCVINNADEKECGGFFFCKNIWNVYPA